MLQFFSASTSIVDSKRAMAECLENALAGENSLDCDLLIIYTGMGHNFKDLLNEAHRIAPSAQVVGCTCAGVIGKEGPIESLRALAIMAVKGPKEEFAVTGEGSARGFDGYSLGQHLANDLKSKCPGINMIFYHPSVIFPLGTALQGNRVIAGIESVFGTDIPILGGASVDNMKLISSFQFLGDQVFEQAAVMFGFADPTLEVISQANHGFEVFGDPFVITRSSKDLVYELDGKPAWKRWTERLGLPETTSPADVLVFAPLATELPEEFHEEYDNKYILFGTMPLPDKSLIGINDLPETNRYYLTRRNEAKIHDGVERLMVRILDRLGGRKPVAVFHADCAARGKLLFNRIIKEEIISQLQYPLCRGENIPWFGMYGGAEFTPLGGKNRLHSYTTSLYVIVKKKPETVEEKVSQDRETVRKSRLFESTSLRNISLKNRFIWSATWQGRANFDGSTSPLQISSLLPAARGGAGMIIGEMAYVMKSAAAAPRQLGIYGDNHIPGLRRMADFVHKTGTPVILQLVHCGLMTSPILSGSTPLGPSVLETPDGSVGKEMTQEDIREAVEAFSNAAIRAKEAGFEGVQIHGAHGWLLSQFLSPFFNKRTDEYGGSLENRSRIVREVVQKIRGAVGDDFAILVKINSDDFLPGGFAVNEMIEVCSMLENDGIDAVELSGGTQGALVAGNPDGSYSPVSKKGVYYLEAAKQYKERIKIPLILVGGIRTFEDADGLVMKGIADYVSMCRPLIREPDLIKKWQSGNLKESDCVSDDACFQPGIDGRGVHCVHVRRS